MALWYFNSPLTFQELDDMADALACAWEKGRPGRPGRDIEPEHARNGRWTPGSVASRGRRDATEPDAYKQGSVSLSERW